MASDLRQVLPGPKELAARAAELFLIAASSAISARGVFNVAFSGGSTPELFFAELSKSPFKDRMAWDKVHVFFADERCVPPSDGMSNFRGASEALLSKVNANVHRIEGELGPEEAARRYAHVIHGVLGAEPVLDMIFLGMGADGHTASLFPDSDALSENSLPAVAVPDKSPARVSITLPLINAARTVVFHVTGLSKAATVKGVLGDTMPEAPASRVTSRALWLLDAEAASELER